jgi:hypothetical protein
VILVVIGCRAFFCLFNRILYSQFYLIFLSFGEKKFPIRDTCIHYEEPTKSCIFSYKLYQFVFIKVFSSGYIFLNGRGRAGGWGLFSSRIIFSSFNLPIRVVGKNG